MANKILNDFKLQSESWQYCDFILSKAQTAYTKIIALGILEDVIKAKWLLLPENQRLGIRNFLVDILIKNVTDDQSFTNNGHFINKLNYVIVLVRNNNNLLLDSQARVDFFMADFYLGAVQLE
jgi:exportin-1